MSEEEKIMFETNRIITNMETCFRNKIKELEQENKQLKKQLNYLRSGEYYNQLRFERNMLEDLVDKGELSKEDKEFIDCTHRNTELLEENKQLKNKIKQAIIYIRNIDENDFINTEHYTELLNILEKRDK